MIASAPVSAHIITLPLALTLGTRLGVYEITAQIGEGGMGQVYRARDTKLNRDVALKVLPAAFIADRAPAHLRGRYQSSLGITYALAFTIGPVGGTALYSVWPKGLWITCAALGVMGAALALAAQRYPAPTVAVPPPG